MPEEWEAAIVDGLLDLELMMTPGPEPTLTASAGGVDVVYLPGPETTQGLRLTSFSNGVGDRVFYFLAIDAEAGETHGLGRFLITEHAEH